MTSAPAFIAAPTRSRPPSRAQPDKNDANSRSRCPWVAASQARESPVVGILHMCSHRALFSVFVRVGHHEVCGVADSDIALY